MLTCVNDDGRVAGVYLVGRGATGRTLPVHLCAQCAEEMTLGDVVRLSRALHRRPAARLTVTTVEAVEASKRPQKRQGGTGSHPPAR